MELLKKLNAVLAGLLVLLAFGCGGTEEDPTPDPVSVPAATARHCRVTESSSHVYGYEYAYTYNAAGQVIKAVRTSPLTYLSNYDLVEYNTLGLVDKITRKKADHTLSEYRIYEYTPDLLVQKETKYALANPADSTSAAPFTFNEYTYDAQRRLTRITYFAANQPATPSGFTAFTFRPDGSLLEEQYNNDLITVSVSREYQFTNSKAPAEKVAYFDLWDSLQPPSAGILFNKVPASITQTHYNSTGTVVQQNTFQYNYTFNADGYPLVQSMGTPGQQPLINSWTYNCQ